MSAYEAARAALREKQGAGARYDANNAPHDDLLLARRGAAYFARKLNELEDDALCAPLLRENWTRRHLIAHISNHARAIARLMEAARTGEEIAFYPSSAARDAEIELGATLPTRALRHLYEHSTKHLDVEWRDLPDDAWDRLVKTLDGEILARCTPRLRAVELWQGAIDLDNGGRKTDIPKPLSHE